MYQRLSVSLPKIRNHTMKQYIFIIISLFTLTQYISAQDYNTYVQCEDTCRHIHGIDLSHYQGDVFWETIGENSKMAYVYLKATEGGTYRQNIRKKYRISTQIWFKSWLIPFFST